MRRFLWLATFLLVIGGVRIVAAEEPVKGADRAVKIAQRKVLWTEPQKLRDEGKRAEAIELALNMIVIERMLFGEDNAELIESWNFIADVAESAEDWSHAGEARAAAWRIAATAYGKSDWRTTDARLARDNMARLKFLSADDRRALRGAAEAGQKVVRLHAAAQFEEAVKVAKAVLAVQERLLGPEHPDTATSLNNMAVLYRAQGNYAAAEPLYQRALKVREKVLGSEHPDTATSLNDLAVLYDAQGNYAAAEPLFERALAITEKALGPGDPNTADILNNLAALYRAQGNYAVAEPLYELALKIYEKALGLENPGPVNTLNNLATLHIAQGNYAAAEPLCQRALTISEKALGPEHPRTVTSLNNLAGLYHVQSNYAAAEPLYRRALTICEKVFGSEHPDTAISLHNLAGLYDAQGNYTAAEPLYQRALMICEKALGPEHPTTANSLKNLGLLSWRIDDAEAARPLVARGLEIQLRHLDRTASIQSEQQQFLMAQTLSNHLDAWLTVTSAEGSSAAEAWRYVLAWKGLTTSRQLGLRQALKDDPAYLAYRMVGQQLSALILSPPSPPSEPAVLAAWNERAPQLRKQWEERKQNLQDEWERLEKELARKFAAFGQARDTARVTPELVQQQLSRAIGDAALVDLVQYWYFGQPTEKSQWRYAAFVIRADEIERVELGASEPIERQLAAWRAGFGRADENDGPGADLRRSLWEPIAARLDGVDAVLISPHGVLAQLPWGALPGETQGTYLIEERALAVIPTPQLLPQLLEHGRSGRPPRTMLLAGDIDYGADAGASVGLLADSRAAGRTRDGKLLAFGRLQSAQAELASIERRYRKKVRGGESDTLEGAEATEAAFRDQAGRHEWLHVITHGFFAPETIKSALETARAASPALGFGDLNSRPRPVGVHPGLLSGLAFAGANSPPQEGKDDGILTAFEVSALDLSQVDTVVLSACETGLGEVAGGEGLLGLQRAFQVAGAKTVVASLWKVPDRATSTLMQRFYENLWDKKMGKLAALREAQIWMMRDKGNRGLALGDDAPDPNAPLPPYFWAAFVLSGDWR